MKDLSLSRRKKPKVKIVCSFNGTFLRRHPSGKLRYTGGETRIISVDRTVGFSRLKSKIWELIRFPDKRRRTFYLQYRISDTGSTEEQSPLVLIASDDDVRCMIDAYEKLELYGKYHRLWIYVCNDNEYFNLQNLQSIVLCESDDIDCFEYMSHVKSEILYDNGFASNNLAAKICGGELGREKVKKALKSGDKVKSRNESLRKIVLRQQLLAKQSVLNQSFHYGLGLAIEEAGMECSSFKNESCSDASVGLSFEIEDALICGPTNPSFGGSSYRSNTVDYKYHHNISREIRACVDSVSLSTSLPLYPMYPKNGNSGVGINASNLALLNAGKISDTDSSYSIDVLPFPKPCSVVSYYDAMCESGSVEPAALSKLNRENIMPWAVGSPRSSIGLAPLSCSNQLLGGLSTASSSYVNSDNGICNYHFVPGNIRKHRIYASHSRSDYNNFTKTRNHRKVRLDGRPWTEKFYPGIQSSSVISKQGQIVKPSFPTLLKPWPGSHDQPVYCDVISSQRIIYNPTCSFSFSRGSEENISKQRELGFPQEGNTNLERHFSYHGPHPCITDQFSSPLAGAEKFPGCTEVVGTQINFLDSPNQHSVTNQHDVANISRSLNITELGSSARLSETGVTCKSFNKKRSAASNMQESVDISLHNLSLLSLGDLQPSTYSTNGKIIDALVTPQSMALNLMDQEHFGTGPHGQISREAVPFLSSDKTMELHDGNKKVAVLQQDVKSALNAEDEKEIKMLSEKSQANGQIPKEIASVYNHLATGELQTIRNSDLEYIRELGSGTYGTVFYGKWKGSDVAIKRLKPGCFDGGAMEENRLVADFWKEAYILGQLRHPNIVALYGVVTDGPATNLATVTEFMINGSLRQVFRRKDRTIDRRKRLIIAMDAAFGMEYLHEKNIVHFDLKSHNLLVNMRDPRRPVCKIGDLGLSKIKQKTLVSGGVRGTIPWMAPELLSCKSLVTEKIDVYSFGIVMWELLTGEEPYANMRSHEIIAGIIKGTLRPEAPAWCDPAWRSLMEKCWSADPDTRPAFSEITQELRTMAAAMNIK